MTAGVDSGSSLVVIFSNDRSQLKQVMTELKGSLSPGDEAVVVNSGDLETTQEDTFVLIPRAKDLFGQLKDLVVDRSKDFVVFMAPGVAGYGAWLSELVSAFDDLPENSVVIPRSAFCTGPQMVPISDASAALSKGRRHRLARGWAKEYHGYVSLEAAASNLCLAVRTEDLLSELEVTDKDSFAGEAFEDFFARLFAWASGLGGIYISHASLVNSFSKFMSAKPYLDAIPSSEEYPLVSGCLIVKNEEQYLGECLKSLASFVDEIVIYDTGSNDSTIEIAESFGAKVVRGYWDDDFGAARNRSLAHCRGRWILWIDADERTLGDPHKVRGRLADPVLDYSNFECKQIRIRNHFGNGLAHSISHVALRIFLRTEGSFYGALHERVRRRARLDLILEDLVASSISELTIDHLGYLNEVMAKKTKTERNSGLAEKNFDVVSDLEALIQRARTYMFVGEIRKARETALDVLEKLDSSGNNEDDKRWIVATAYSVVIDSLILEDKPELAEEWLEKFEDRSNFMSRPMSFRARIRLLQGRYSEALALFQALPDSEISDDGLEIAFDHYVPEMAECLACLGRQAEAVEMLLGSLERDGVLEVHLGRLVELMNQASIPLSRLAKAVANMNQEMFYAQLLQLGEEVADSILEQIYVVDDSSTVLLATASKVALGLGLERMLEWSARLRMAGYAQFCPLLARANDESVDELDRVVCAAIAYGAFSDLRAREICMSVLDKNKSKELIKAVSVYAPSLLAPSV